MSMTATVFCPVCDCVRWRGCEDVECPVKVPDVHTVTLETPASSNDDTHSTAHTTPTSSDVTERTGDASQSDYRIVDDGTGGYPD